MTEPNHDKSVPAQLHRASTPIRELTPILDDRAKSPIDQVTPSTIDEEQQNESHNDGGQKGGIWKLQLHNDGLRQQVETSRDVCIAVQNRLIKTLKTQVSLLSRSLSVEQDVTSGLTKLWREALERLAESKKIVSSRVHRYLTR